MRATKAMATALANLVRIVWQEMELAGEMGSLLKIEETLGQAIAEARKASEEKNPLFRVLEYDLGTSPATHTGLDFWDHAEQMVLVALQYYVEKATNGHYRRHLFAGDAEQGFAFIELCQKLYDVVLMNPPFGVFVKRVQAYSRAKYPNTYNDIFAAFTDRFLDKMDFGGIFGAITSRNGFFLGSFKNWRRDIFMKRSSLKILADLGENIMDDAMVEAAAYCFQRSEQIPNSEVTFFRLVGRKDRETKLAEEIRCFNRGIPSEKIFIRHIDDFRSLRLFPFVYWVRKRILVAFSQAGTLDPDVASVRCGLSTGNNYRFVRALWEIPSEGITNRWIPLVMTGTSQPWYSPLLVAVDWKNDGDYLRSFPGSTFRSQDYYFRPGMSWTRRAVRFIPYAIPAGCIPTASRYMAFPQEGYERKILGFCGSNVIGAFMRFFGENFNRPNYLVDTVKSSPWLELDEEFTNLVEIYVEDQLSKRRKSYQFYEPFHEFLMPRKVAHLQKIAMFSLSFDYNHLLSEELEEDSFINP